MTSSNFTISSNTVFNQKLGLLSSIVIIIFFSLFILIDWNINYLLITLFATLFLLPFIIFSSKFYDIRIEGGLFKMQNFFRPSVELEAALFEKITVMETILWRPNNPYFTVHFKNGGKYNFTKKTFGSIKYPFQDKRLLATEQTEAIIEYLKRIKEEQQQK